MAELDFIVCGGGSATFEVANFHHGGDGQGQCRGGQR